MNKTRVLSISIVFTLALLMIFSGLLTAFNPYSSIEVTKKFLLEDGTAADTNNVPGGDFNFTVELLLDEEVIATDSGTGDDVLSFEDLGTGTYTVRETNLGSEWTVNVDGTGTNSTDVILEAGAEVTVAITNTYMRVIISETAWVAHFDGDYKYNEGRGRGRGNWATYVKTARVEDEGAVIYAGQDNFAGDVIFDVDGEEVTITINLDGWAFEPDTTNLYVQGYSSEPSGNPAPGRFEYKQTESGSNASITVPFDEYYGIHLNVYALY